jgi:hypothetical protein
MSEIQRIIREEEPLKPSTKLSTMGEKLTIVAKHRHSSPDLLTKLVRGDLDWIVMRTLEKNRNRRYDTASELATDIERHLNHEPVKAAAPSVLYRMRKFVRRNRFIVTAGFLIIAAILLAVVTLSVSTILIWQEQGRTQAAREKETEARIEATQQRDEARYNQYLAQMRLAPHYWEAGQIARLKEMLNSHLPKPGQADLRGWEWYYFLSLCNQDLSTLRGHTSSVASVAWSPDGRRIVSGSGDKTAKIWDVTTDREITTLQGHTAAIREVAWSPDGKRIATASSDKTVKLWDAVSGKELLTLSDHTDRVSSLAWSPDSDHLASGSWDKTVKIWETSTGKQLRTLEGHQNTVYALAYDPSGLYLATSSNEGLVKIWEVDTERQKISWRRLCDYMGSCNRRENPRNTPWYWNRINIMESRRQTNSFSDEGPEGIYLGNKCWGGGLWLARTYRLAQFSGLEPGRESAGVRK